MENTITRLRLVPLLIQVAGALLLLRLFNLESPRFSLASELFLVGAVASWFLPSRARLTVMVLASIAGLFAMFDVATALTILAASLVAAQICRLPIRTSYRLLLLVAFGAALLAWRRMLPTSALATAAVPVIGAMFMLRTLSYLNTTDSQPRGWRETLAFFFILPNYALWFFPLIDFDSFAKGAEKPRDIRVYRVGVDWVLEGILQLILYRVLQSALYMPFEHVTSYGDFFSFLLLNFLAYIRISGAFHVVVGMICLYGVELPKTHKLYLFATDLVDMSRRVNTYWRDFMARHVYRPTYRALRRPIGDKPALWIAVLAVCFGSCLIHSYVYLWSKGIFVLRANDLLFWGIIFGWGATAIYLERRAKKLGRAPSRSRFLSLWPRITVTLFGFCFIWALWTAADLGDLATGIWLLRWRGWSDFAWVALFPALGALGALILLLEQSSLGQKWLDTTATWRWRDSLNIAGLVFACLLALPSLQTRLNEPTKLVLEDVRNPEFEPEFGFQTRQHSYYEGFKTTGTEHVDEDEMPIEQQPYFEPVSDFRRRRLRPSVRTTFMKHEFFTNRWRMNDDRDFPLEKDPGGTRVALMSASNSMSYGVPNRTQWPRVSEDLLSKDGFSKVEFLNFSNIGYCSLFGPYTLENVIKPFVPDIGILASTSRDLWVTGFDISTALRTGLTVPNADELAPLLGIPDTTGFLARHYPVQPSYETEFSLFKWTVHKIAEIAATQDMDLVYVSTPMVFLASEGEHYGVRWDERKMMDVARANGYAVIDLSRVLDDYRPEEVTLMDDPRNYNHFNERGHRIIAEAFSKEFARYLKERRKRLESRQQARATADSRGQNDKERRTR